MRWNLVCVIGFSLVFPGRAAADVDSYCVYSLEWLVDASQSVQLVTVGKKPGAGAVGITRVERVLKSAGETPEPSAADLAAAVGDAGGQRVLLFLRPVPKKTTPEVLYVVHLNKWTLPENAGERSAAYRKAIPEGFPLPKMTESDKCVAIDRTGRILVDPDEVIKLVERRAKLHPKRVTDAGFLSGRGEALEDHNSAYFVFAPFDPEEREPFLKQLRGGGGVERAKAAGYLAHYPDAAVIAALKECLTDDYFNSQDVDDGKGGRPRSASVYIVRGAAYESLRKLKVDVPKPELEHRR